MNKADKKKQLKEMFSRLYKGCVLYAIQLDGFTHKIFYKDKDNIRHIDTYTGCAPEMYKDDTPEIFNNKVVCVRSMNKDRTKLFFEMTQTYNYMYQCNAAELIYKDARGF